MKLAHSDGMCVCRPFALWKTPGQLSAALTALVQRFPEFHTVALTMTGELADCFATKREGVAHIVDCVTDVSGGRELLIWSTAGEFVDRDVAREYPRLVASANWHALASWAGQLVPGGSAILIDVGSTTTDIIPLADGRPVSRGLTDLERLQSRELEYCGISRTPLFALAHSVPFRGGRCTLAAETFATTLDLYLWLGLVEEDPKHIETANGRSATREHSRDRLCHTLCSDRDEISEEDLDLLCQFLLSVQETRIGGCLEVVAGRLETDLRGIILSGGGTFLAERVLRESPRWCKSTWHRVNDLFTPEISESACAFAVSRLAESI